MHRKMQRDASVAEKLRSADETGVGVQVVSELSQSTGPPSSVLMC